MLPDGPYALCWLARGTRRVVKARLPMRTLDDAVAWAAKMRADMPWAPFWLEAWD